MLRAACPDATFRGRWAADGAISLPRGKHVLSGFEGTGLHGVPDSRAGGLRVEARACSSVGQSTRLISVGSVVQIYPGPPAMLHARGGRGISSAGRAPGLQPGGHRFEPGILHQFRRLAEMADSWCRRFGARWQVEKAAKPRQVEFGRDHRVVLRWSRGAHSAPRRTRSGALGVPA